MGDAHLAARYGRFHDPIPSHRSWSCGFGEDRSSPRCGVDAVWHGIVLTEDRASIVAAMACCDQHRPAMGLSVDYAHAMDSACLVPGGRFRWPGNYCYLPETDGALEAMRIVEVPTGWRKHVESSPLLQAARRQVGVPYAPGGSS